MTLKDVEDCRAIWHTAYGQYVREMEASRVAEPQLMTIRQVADRFGVHPETVRRWERTGVIATAVRRRGQRVYDESAMARIAASVLRRPAAMPQGTKEDG